MKLRNVITEQAKVIASSQLDILDFLLPQIFKSTLEYMDDGTTYFNIISSQLLNTALDTAWLGSNYSERVWNNTNELAARLNEDILNMVILGKNPTDIKRQIKDDLGVSYRMADRLIRTESSHIFNTAAIAGYKARGVKQVKYIHKGKCSSKCDCHSLDGKVFDIGTEPLLPRHPNCICCYAPVVDLKPQKILDNEQ